MSAESGADGSLGRVVAMRRTELGLKRKELAARASLSYPYISEIENGVKEPSAKALRSIAEALEMKVTDLVALTERIGETPPESRSILSLAAPPHAPAPETLQAWEIPDDRSSESLRNEFAAPATSASRVVASQKRTPSPVDQTVKELVDIELRRWVREELPAIVEREIERRMNERESDSGA